PLSICRALVCRAGAPSIAAGVSAGRRVHRHDRGRDRTRCAPSCRDPARPDHRSGRGALLHLAVGSQAADMTVLSADGLFLRRGGANLLAGVSLSLGPTGSVAVVGPTALGGACIVTIADAIPPAALPPARIPLRPFTALAGGRFLDLPFALQP